MKPRPAFVEEFSRNISSETASDNSFAESRQNLTAVSWSTRTINALKLSYLKKLNCFLCFRMHGTTGFCVTSAPIQSPPILMHRMHHCGKRQIVFGMDSYFCFYQHLLRTM